MKKMSLCILSIILVGIVTSCSSVKTSTARQMEAEGRLKQTTTLVDLTVSPNKVSASMLISKAEARTLRVSVLKEKAIALALREAGADVLVEPRFEIETKGLAFVKRITKVSVSGYPATYAKFRTISESDKELIKQEFIINDLPNVIKTLRPSVLIPMKGGIGILSTFDFK